MRHALRYLLVLAFIAPLLQFTTESLGAQTRLSYGFHLSPEVNRMSSTARPSDSKLLTTGKWGSAISASLGGYLEYELSPNIFVRGGMNLTHRRHKYSTERRYEESDVVSHGYTKVSYYGIEMPGAIVARTNYLRNNGRFLIGFGGVLNRWIGDPKIESTFRKASDERNWRSLAHQSVTGFIGYEFELSSHSSMSIEPYISYTPTRFYFENYTITDLIGEGGISFRVRFDT